MPPHADKGWSFQIVNITDDDVWTIRSQFPKAAVEAAKPFLQGNSGGWAMVEFWNPDKAAVDVAAAVMFEAFNLAVIEGQFSREDLGI